MKTRFFRFERHMGDDNDNSIGEIIVEAIDKQSAFDRLPTLDKSQSKDVLESSGYEQDGDEDSLTQMWNSYTDGRTGDNIDLSDLPEDFDDDDICSIPYHADFYFQAEYETADAAQKDRATHHTDIGILFLES